MIFGFSSVPGLSSGLKEDYFLRKVAHAAEYAVLAYLVYNLTKKYGAGWKYVIISALATFAYAFTDEIHQDFVPGRSGNFFDIGVDTSGILVAVLLIVIGVFRRRKQNETI